MNISRYGINDQYTITTHGTNPSTIITKMIQLAGRFCEYYASDIVFEAVNFRNAVEHNQPYHKYLFFRESGVDAYTFDELEYSLTTDNIQVWALRYEPGISEGIQTFQRMYISRK